MEKTHEVIEICLLAGKIMLESGAETYRVEDTMSRIAASFGLQHTHSYVTPTAIIFSIDGTQSAKLVRISERSTDLHKVATVNSISRQISSEGLSMYKAKRLLLDVKDTSFSYNIFLKILAAAIASGCFLIMFNGGWDNFFPALIAGGIGFACLEYIQRLVHTKFFAEVMASFVIGLLALLFVKIGFGFRLDKIIIGSVMPLVPGLLITNAVRDLMAGHLVSGLSRGAEAFLTAFAIGTGIAVVLSFV